MSKEEAIRLIILDYCSTHDISTSEFARKCGISKAYISKIVNKGLGKYGISSTIQNLLATGIKITDNVEFEKLIKQYQNNNQVEYNAVKNSIITKISDNLDKYNEKDLEIINSIIENSNSEKLSLLYDLLKNMR